MNFMQLLSPSVFSIVMNLAELHVSVACPYLIVRLSGSQFVAGITKVLSRAVQQLKTKKTKQDLQTAISSDRVAAHTFGCNWRCLCIDLPGLCCCPALTVIIHMSRR